MPPSRRGRTGASSARGAAGGAHLTQQANPQTNQDTRGSRRAGRAPAGTTSKRSIALKWNTLAIEEQEMMLAKDGLDARIEWHWCLDVKCGFATGSVIEWLKHWSIHDDAWESCFWPGCEAKHPDMPHFEAHLGQRSYCQECGIRVDERRRDFGRKHRDRLGGQHTQILYWGPVEQAQDPGPTALFTACPYMWCPVHESPTFICVLLPNPNCSWIPYSPFPPTDTTQQSYDSFNNPHEELEAHSTNYNATTTGYDGQGHPINDQYNESYPYFSQMLGSVPEQEFEPIPTFPHPSYDDAVYQSPIYNADTSPEIIITPEDSATVYQPDVSTYNPIQMTYSTIQLPKLLSPF